MLDAGRLSFNGFSLSVEGEKPCCLVLHFERVVAHHQRVSQDIKITNELLCDI